MFIDFWNCILNWNKENLCIHRTADLQILKTSPTFKIGLGFFWYLQFSTQSYWFFNFRKLKFYFYPCVFCVVWVCLRMCMSQKDRPVEKSETCCSVVWLDFGKVNISYSGGKSSCWRSQLHVYFSISVEGIKGSKGLYFSLLFSVRF